MSAEFQKHPESVSHFLSTKYLKGPYGVKAKEASWRGLQVQLSSLCEHIIIYFQICIIRDEQK